MISNELSLNVLSEDERAEVIKAYMESLDLKQKEVEKRIEEDEELKKTSDAIDFMEKLQKGEVQLGESVSAKRDEGDSNNG